MNEEQIEAIRRHFENMNYSFKATQRYNELIQYFNENTSCYSNDIVKTIDSIVFDTNSEKFIKELPSGFKFYRARVINIDDIKSDDKGISYDDKMFYGYNESNSRECPLMYGESGRNNIAGQSYLYVAEDELTACYEIKSGLRQLISLACFETKKNLRIIDFSKDVAFESQDKELYGMSLGVFFTRLLFAYSKPVIDKNEYRVTQILSDYLRKTGIDGIAYRSFYTGKANYTIFNCHSKNVEFINSRILTHQFQNSTFWDFNNKKSIKLTDVDDEYNEEIATSIIKDLQQSMKKR